MQACMTKFRLYVLYFRSFGSVAIGLAPTTVNCNYYLQVVLISRLHRVFYKNRIHKEVMHNKV